MCHYLNTASLGRRLAALAQAALVLLFLGACGAPGAGPAQTAEPATPARVRVGAEALVGAQLANLKGKRVALCVNHTARLPGGPHLLDTLLGAGVQVVRVFAPEHGFRGEAEAGAHVRDGKDARTGVPIVSLYGNKKQPAPEDLADVDLVVFDIQDVGARFYTYSTTLSYLMGACAQAKLPLWVLDRPNPNGFLCEGPVLAPGQESFVGLHPIPIIHGLTMGEYAQLVNTEGWTPGGKRCSLVVVPCEGYRHAMRWADTGLPWVAPSPNLPTAFSAECYPLLCWFEGTPVSVGRGTETPFTVVGAPWHGGFRNQLKKDSILGGPQPYELAGMHGQAVAFRPRGIPGKAERPPYRNLPCAGFRIDSLPPDGRDRMLAALWLLRNFHAEYAGLETQVYGPFFTPFFDKLAGEPQLQRQTAAGAQPSEIYESWAADLGRFRKLRARYLRYP